MAITTYSELQTAINTWTNRSYSAAQIKEFISLAEARLNRELGAVVTSQTLTGTISSRELDISSYSVDQPLQLFFTDDGNDESRISKRDFANMRFIDDAGEPREWAVKNFDTIVLDRPCDEAYSFRLVFDQKFALSDAATTNWMLTNHPDVYLAACLLWSGAFTEDFGGAAAWEVILKKGIPDVKSILAGFRRSLLQIDPALTAISRNRSRTWDGNNG